MIEVTGLETYDGDIHGKGDDCEYIEGNVSKRIEIDKHTKACEIRADLEVAKRKTIRIWGQIRDCKGKPVKCALIKLVKEVKKHCKTEYEGVAHTITDCLGFYQFDICAPKDHKSIKFRIIVSKQAIGKEIVIKKAACDPCDDPCPCADHHSCSCADDHSNDNSGSCTDHHSNDNSGSDDDDFLN